MLKMAGARIKKIKLIADQFWLMIQFVPDFRIKKIPNPKANKQATLKGK